MSEKKKSAAERMFDIFLDAVDSASYWAIDYASEDDIKYGHNVTKSFVGTQLEFALDKIMSCLRAQKEIALDIGNGQRAYVYDSDFWILEDREKLLKNPPLQMMYDYLYAFLCEIADKNWDLAASDHDPARRFEASFMASAACLVLENVKCEKKKVRRIIGGSRKGGAE